MVNRTSIDIPHQSSFDVQHRTLIDMQHQLLSIFHILTDAIKQAIRSGVSDYRQFVLQTIDSLYCKLSILCEQTIDSLFDGIYTW